MDDDNKDIDKERNELFKLINDKELHKDRIDNLKLFKATIDTSNNNFNIRVTGMISSHIENSCWHYPKSVESYNVDLESIFKIIDIMIESESNLIRELENSIISKKVLIIRLESYYNDPVQFSLN